MKRGKMSTYDRQLRRLNTGNEYEREEALRELLAADSDEDDIEDPFDVGGDDQDNYTDYVQENEVEDSEYEDIDEYVAEATGPIENLPEPDELLPNEEPIVNEPANEEFFLAPSGRKWLKQPEISVMSRIQGSNIFKPGGPIGPAANLKNASLLVIFNRIFNTKIKNQIIKYTNEKALDVYMKLNKNRTKQRVWKPLTLNELNAYFGILLYIGALRDGHRRLRTLWDPSKGHLILRAVMSCTRFEMINTFLRFDDSIGRRGQNTANRNLLQPVQILLTEINETLSANYIKVNNRKQYRPTQSSMFGFSDRMDLVSYVPKPNKQVLLLSTQLNRDKATSGYQKKPNMIIDYNRTKGGVDVFDQMVSIYSCSRQTRRWPMVIFYNLLNVAALATVIIYRHFNPPRKNKNLFRNDKLIELAEELMESELEDRAHISRQNTISKSSLDALRTMGRISQVIREVDEKLPRKQARCHLCPRKDDKKTKTTCDVCGKNFCPRHHNDICVGCLPELPNVPN